MTSRTPSSGVHLQREPEIDEDVPREVIGMALAAFDTRRPGVEVLNLVHDTVEPSRHVGGGEPRELCFSSDSVTVTLKVAGHGDGVRVNVNVTGVEGLVLALEQLDPSGRVVARTAPSNTVEGVSPGFTRVTGTHPGCSTPVWCTAWTQL